MDRFVDTPYGPAPGCPECDVIVLRGLHICEHGVTPEQRIEVTMTATIEDESLYRRLLGE